jgi:hypothetical protein
MVVLEHIWGPIVGLFARWLAKFVPSQASLDARANALRIAVLEGQAVSGASDEAAEQEHGARQHFVHTWRMHDIDMQYINEEQRSAKRNLATDAAKPIPGKIPVWQFWRRRAASKEMQERTARIAASNESINECGIVLQRSAKTYAAMTCLLQQGSSKEAPANTSGIETGAPAKAPGSKTEAPSRPKSPGRVSLQ